VTVAIRFTGFMHLRGDSARRRVFRLVESPSAVNFQELIQREDDGGIRNARAGVAPPPQVVSQRTQRVCDGMTLDCRTLGFRADSILRAPGDPCLHSVTNQFRESDDVGPGSSAKGEAEGEERSRRQGRQVTCSSSSRTDSGVPDRCWLLWCSALLFLLMRGCSGPPNAF
jgi:hypothetical protein